MTITRTNFLLLKIRILTCLFQSEKILTWKLSPLDVSDIISTYIYVAFNLIYQQFKYISDKIYV